MIKHTRLNIQRRIQMDEVFDSIKPRERWLKIGCILWLLFVVQNCAWISNRTLEIIAENDKKRPLCMDMCHVYSDDGSQGLLSLSACAALDWVTADSGTMPLRNQATLPPPDVQWRNVETWRATLRDLLTWTTAVSSNCDLTELYSLTMFKL